MKCEFCTADVPPQWVHSINTNTCPSCGGQLMSSEQQKTLAEVREAMNQMPNNPEQLASWLLDKFQLKKIGDEPAAPTEFHQRKMSAPTIQAVEHQEQDHSPANGKKPFANKFLSRAGVQIKDAAFYKALTEQQNGSIDLNNLPDDGEEAFMPGNDDFDDGSGSPLHQASRDKRLQSHDAVMGGGGAFRRS